MEKKPDRLARFHVLSQQIAKTAGPLDTVVCAFIAHHRDGMARVAANPCGPALAILARSLLVEALDMMADANDEPSMALADAIEAAIAALPDLSIREESDHL